MKIQIVTRNANGCDYYRCVLPAMYLQKDVEWSKSNSIEMLWIAQDEWKIECDILWYNKLIWTSIAALRQMQQEGMKVIVDVDDYWVLPNNHTHYDHWMEPMEGNLQSNMQLTIDHIKNADLVTCTSIRLQEKIRELNKNTIVIPNAFPFGQGCYKPDIIEPHQQVTFLYAGGVTHLPDVQLLEGKFKRIGSDDYIKKNAKFIIAGYDKKKETRRVYTTKTDMEARNSNYTTEVNDVVGPYDHMKRIFSYTNSYEVINTKPVTQYLNSYDLADVVLAPLVEKEWNSYKSEIKVLEAATRNIPIICSNSSPYKDLRPCEGIMYVEHPDDWIKYIRKCIKESQWRIDMGSKLAEWIHKEYELTIWNETRKQVFDKLINT